MTFSSTRVLCGFGPGDAGSPSEGQRLPPWPSGTTSRLGGPGGKLGKLELLLLGEV